MGCIVKNVVAPCSKFNSPLELICEVSIYFLISKPSLVWLSDTKTYHIYNYLTVINHRKRDSNISDLFSLHFWLYKSGKMKSVNVLYRMDLDVNEKNYIWSMSIVHFRPSKTN